MPVQIKALSQSTWCCQHTMLTNRREGIPSFAEFTQLPNNEIVLSIHVPSSGLLARPCRMTAEVYERERSRMQLGPQRGAPSGWASARQAPPPGSSNLPSIAFRTPPSQPAAVQHGSEVATVPRTGVSPASGALRSLARQHALPGVLRFGGNGRPPHDWRLLMKVCAARVLVRLGVCGACSSMVHMCKHDDLPSAMLLPDTVYVESQALAAWQLHRRHGRELLLRELATPGGGTAWSPSPRMLAGVRHRGLTNLSTPAGSAVSWAKRAMAVGSASPVRPSFERSTSTVLARAAASVSPARAMTPLGCEIATCCMRRVCCCQRSPLTEVGMQPWAAAHGLTIRGTHE